MSLNDLERLIDWKSKGYITQHEFEQGKAMIFAESTPKDISAATSPETYPQENSSHDNPDPVGFLKSKRKFLKQHRTKVGGLLVILSFIIVGRVVGRVAGNIFKSDEIAQILNDSARELGAKCPFMIDSEVRADAVGIDSAGRILLTYTVVNYSKFNSSQEYNPEIIKSNLVRNISSNDDGYYFRRARASFVYRYQDRDGAPMFQITITPWDYLNLWQYLLL
jgi:hypothetical protein